MPNPEVKKFAVVGTSFTRRARLFEDLKMLFPKNPWAFFVPDVGVPYLQTHPSVRALFAPGVERELQAMMLHNEKVAHDAGATMIVTNGSVLDGPMRAKGGSNELLANELIARVRDWLHTYTHMFVVEPTSKSDAENRDRFIPANMRIYMHEALLQILQEERLAHTVLPGGPQERYIRASTIIDR